MTHRTTCEQTAMLKAAGCYLSPSALKADFQQEAGRAGRNGGQPWQGQNAAAVGGMEQSDPSISHQQHEHELLQGK